MKKVYISEKQIKSILGEDFTSYLDKSDHGCDFPKDSNPATGDETLDTAPGGKPVTLDKISASRVKNHPFFRKATYGTFYESVKKKLNERSEENSNLKVTPNKSAKLDKNEKGVRLNTLDVRLHRKKEELKNVQMNSPEYKKLQKEISALEQSIKRGSNTASILNNNCNIQDNSINSIANVNDGSGKGHHKQNTIYYENN